jgi:beta-galactosidase
MKTAIDPRLERRPGNSMKPITVSPICFSVDDKPFYLLSGEFHYFRVPKRDWRARMQLFKEAGGNCLATYVPWLLHEPEEGHFCFDGEDWLNLEGFFQTAAEEGLYVIARPGPYQYSELVYHGLPGWLIKQYPEILARNVNGKPFGYASVSYTHPLFLQKVRNWFAAVCPILARYTISRGGPIAFTQIDNETVGIHEWFGSLDYHPTSMGIGKVLGKYPLFLEKHYGNITALNEAYGKKYTAFQSVRPIPPRKNQVGAIRVKKDYFDFYLSSIADYAQSLVDMLRANGIDTPIIHNSGNPGMNAYFTETAQRLGDQFVLGSDHYYNLDQNWPQNNPTPQYAARTFISLEMLRLMCYPPSVLEIPGGSASDWPPVTPDDARATYMTNLALGMKGSNYYIFTGGPNPPGAGHNTDLYDYGASIGANGDIRPLYKAQKDFGKFVHNHANLLTSERGYDFRIGMDLEYARSEQYWSERGPFLFSNVDAWQFLRKGVLSSALCASLSPKFVNLGADDWVNDIRTPLVIASSASMAEEKQRRVVRFLKQGGNVLFAPVVPTVDENLQPLPLLAEYLGGPAQSANAAGLARPHIGPVLNVNGTTYPFEHLPQNARVLGVDEFTGQPIAVEIHPEGTGRAVILGLSWIQAMREHERMFAHLLGELGLEQAIVCSNPNLWVTLYPGDKRSTLFVLNLFTVPQEAHIRVRLKPGGPLVDVGHVQVKPITVIAVDIKGNRISRG